MDNTVILGILLFLTVAITLRVDWEKVLERWYQPRKFEVAPDQDSKR